MIGGEQAIERQQARKQRADPENRGAEFFQKREIGADRERHQHHDGEEKQHADQRTTADAQRNANIPTNQRGEGGHAERLPFS